MEWCSRLRKRYSNDGGLRHKDLVNIKGLSEAKIEKILTAAHTMKVSSLESSTVDSWRVLHGKRDDDNAPSRDADFMRR